MNPGGEPERDDTGLPPVDIEIPDDARELDRDVQAYYREQRAVRRQQRRTRFHGVLAKDGIVLPLLACCLILALITGTLLTVFTAASDQGFPALSGAGGQPGSTGKAAGGPRTGAPSTGPATAGPTGAARASTAAGARTPAGAGTARPTSFELPAATVQVGARPVGLRSLSRAVLLLVPPACACATAVAQLARFAATAQATAYLVSPASQHQAVSQLAGQVRSQYRASVTVAVDSGNVLGQYRHGLTAVLVGPHHTAVVATKLQAGENFSRLASALAH